MDAKPFKKSKLYQFRCGHIEEEPCETKYSECSLCRRVRQREKYEEQQAKYSKLGKLALKADICDYEFDDPYCCEVGYTCENRRFCKLRFELLAEGSV